MIQAIRLSGYLYMLDVRKITVGVILGATGLLTVYSLLS